MSKALLPQCPYPNVPPRVVLRCFFDSEKMTFLDFYDMYFVVFVIFSQYLVTFSQYLVNI